ncbi:unnamed protein product [[Candida] boidinii]|uniref:Unnamed protein product n=1 Tax=Candida boidinii TaxID=5477 RepID=A0A9W6SYP4_CANBO|nr:hypothetical protein B5S30_g1133 [[Candida] boidinii]GME69981.1 unnamed protein product [[Candida] boidinii]GMF98124.1 unnamed protein product [[Candida] boidinii]
MSTNTETVENQERLDSNDILQEYLVNGKELNQLVSFTKFNQLLKQVLPKGKKGEIPLPIRIYLYEAMNKQKEKNLVAIKNSIKNDLQFDKALITSEIMELKDNNLIKLNNQLSNLNDSILVEIESNESKINDELNDLKKLTNLISTLNDDVDTDNDNNEEDVSIDEIYNKLDNLKKILLS